MIKEIEKDLQVERRMTVASIFNAIGGVSGLIALFTIAVYGGEMKRQININTGAIRDLQTIGSSSLQTHVAVDARETSITAERVSNISRLVEKLVEHNTELVQQVTKLIDIIKFQNPSKEPTRP